MYKRQAHNSLLRDQRAGALLRAFHDVLGLFLGRLDNIDTVRRDGFCLTDLRRHIQADIVDDPSHAIHIHNALAARKRDVERIVEKFVHLIQQFIDIHNVSSCFLFSRRGRRATMS